MIPVETVKWTENGLVIINQRMLPMEEKYITLKTTEDVCNAIETLEIRGAPAIGVAAAYGVVIAVREEPDKEHVLSSIERLRKTRPTAINLFHALDIMEKKLDDAFASGEPEAKFLELADDIYEEDMQICRSLSKNGSALLSDGDTVLTHCNAGGLATSGYGTALGIVYAALEDGKRISVYVDETRPLLQGGRLSAWELSKNKVQVTVICDNMAAEVLRQGRIDYVIVGADRIVANGDSANKIGTYGLSIAAREHGVPFYIAAPLTSFDFSLKSGREIPIEERNPAEIYSLWGMSEQTDGISFYNPAFDVTPARNISAIISEKGIAKPPFDAVLESWRLDRNTP